MRMSPFAACLVVCPASVRIPWQRELEQWLDRSFTVAVVGVNSQKPLSGNGITIINYDRLSRFTDDLEAYDLAVLDECQYIKIPASRRTLAAFRIRARRRMPSPEPTPGLVSQACAAGCRSSALTF